MVLNIMPDINDIIDAAARIAPFVHRTPLIHSRSFSLMTGADVYIKAENLQKTGSFKVRGACNVLSQTDEGKIIAASMGNHAQGIAYAAALFGKSAEIVMPFSSSISKQEAVRSYGGNVVLHGETFGEALAFALAQKDRYFVHAFDDDGIISGQGTVGLEIVEDLRQVDSVLVPVGGGGLISGVSLAVKTLLPRTEVIGVQSVAARSAYGSFRDKRISDFPPSSTIADGIAVGRVGEKTFGYIRQYVDDIVLVDDESISMAVLLFMERTKLVVEGAGAVAAAALLSDKERFKGRKVALVASGGNIDSNLMDRIIHKGLLKSGRIGIFSVDVEDLPGRLNVLTGIIAARRGNILDVFHDRFDLALPIGKTKVVFTVETRGKEHLEEILSALVAADFTVWKQDGQKK